MYYIYKWMAFASHNLDYCIKCALFNSKNADIYTFFWEVGYDTGWGTERITDKLN